MSTHSGATKSPAPWRATFLEYVNKMEQPAFVLSTLRKAPADSHTPFVPSARYCIFRGMWTELPENKHNDAPQNERIFESDLPTFTTDIRMEKVPELFGSSTDANQNPSDTGFGGAVEAVWWYNGKEPPTQLQWRIRGDAFVVGPDAEEDGKSGVKAVKSQLGKRMRTAKPGKESEWSWTKEVTAHFGNCSPGMRGTFKNPPPGQPVDQPYNEKELGLGNKVESLDDPAARKNFRVVVIRPSQVEFTDISKPTEARRRLYTYNEETGEWSDDDVRWP